MTSIYNELSLFFTRNISLETWLEKGLLEREKLIYEQHLNKDELQKVNWFTYGVNDRDIALELIKNKKLHPSIHVYPMPKIFNSKLGKLVYMFVMPFFYRGIIKNSSILKTNQMDGSIAAVLARFITRVPLLVRTGFTLSLFANKMDKPLLVKGVVALLECIAYKVAEHVMIPSEYDKKHIINSYRLEPHKISVLYNYIDTKKFFNKDVSRLEKRLVTVGRLVEQKNLFNLIDAVSQTEYTLDIYGDGELKEQLIMFAERKGAKINFMGIVPNDQLVDILNQYHFFVLMSNYEGMPKVLLEAMACGCLCAGTDVMGINEVLVNNKNGYIAKSPAVNDILNVLQSLKYENSLVKNSINTIEEKFSLVSYSKKENSIIQGVVI